MKNKFELPIRIYVEDTDCYGVVNHAKHVNFIERARTEWLRHQGFELEDYRQEGIYFAVAHVDIHYRRPLVLNDKIVVTAAIEKLQRSAITFAQTILKENELACEASVKVVCVNNKLRPIALPEKILEKLA